MEATGISWADWASLLLTGAGVAGGLLMYLFRRNSKDTLRNKRLADLEERLKALPCEKHLERLIGLDKQMGMVEKQIDKLPCAEHAAQLARFDERTAK